MALVRCADGYESIDRCSQRSGVLCDQTSHRMSDHHDGVVGLIQFVDQLDEALR